MKATVEKMFEYEKAHPSLNYNYDMLKKDDADLFEEKAAYIAPDLGLKAQRTELIGDFVIVDTIVG